MSLTGKAYTFLGGCVFVVLFLLVVGGSTALGAVGVAAWPLVITFILHYLGIISVGLLKAVVLWFALLGGIIGFFRGLLIAVMLGE